jgi:hypothetical protein
VAALAFLRKWLDLSDPKAEDSLSIKRRVKTDITQFDEYTAYQTRLCGDKTHWKESELQ